MAEFEKNPYSECRLCPRECGVDRTKGQRGFCGQTDKLNIGRASLHMWEEPCVSGEQGSGTVFFSGCTLGCVYCQNFQLSRGNEGVITDEDRLVNIFYELQEKGAANINLVTGEHFAVHIAHALEKARASKLKIPVVFNCGGYVKESTLEMLDGLVDVYLPDFKYMNPETARKYSLAPDYPSVAKAAIAKMVRNCPKVEFDENGMIKKGVIVRHLCLPGFVKESKEIIKYLYETYGNNIYISIMSQYTPLENAVKYPEINRKLKKSEYERILDYAVRIGVENAFIQDGASAKESFIPLFKGEGVL